MENIKDWIKNHTLTVGIIIFAAFLVAYLARLFIRPHNDEWLYVAFVDEYKDVYSTSLYSDYSRLCGEDKEIIFDSKFFFDLSNDKDTTNSYYQKLVAYLEAGTADVIICTKENLDGIAMGGRVLDLNDNRTMLLDKDDERTYWYESDEGERIPIAYSLEDTAYETELGYTSVPYAAIGFNADNIEAAEAFITLLLGQ